MKTKKTQLIRLLLWLLLLGLPAGGFSRLTATADAACDLIVANGESIQSAITAAVNNQIICVRDGVYNEQVKVPVSKTGLRIIAYENEQPIIDGNKRQPSSSPIEQNKALVEIGGEGTVFEGFEVRFSSARGIDVTANNVTVRNNAVHDNWTTGIIIFGGSSALSGILIEDNLVYNNLRKVENIPVIYRGLRTGSDEVGWTFDPDVMWDNPFWSGAEADLPEPYLNGLSMTFNNDGTTNRVYAGSSRAGRAGFIGAEYSANGQLFSYSGNDILFHKPEPVNKWTLFFDGDTLGLGPNPQYPGQVVVIDAFQIESAPPEAACPECAPILMSFAESVTIPVGMGTITPTVVGPSDLVRFSPTAVNEQWGHITAGHFSLYKTAAELGLPAGANVDALDRALDGRLLVSLDADVAAGVLIAGKSVDKEDLAAVVEDTQTWSLYFDGDQIPFNPFGDDLTAAWLDRNGHIYVSGNPVGGSALSFIKTHNSVARGNRVYNNHGEGLVAGRYSENITLEDNVAYDNLHANLYLNATIAPLVRRNLIYCTDDMTFWRKGSNDSYNPAPGLQVRDEAFANMSPPPPPSSDQVIVNNIVVGCSNNFGVGTQREDGVGGLYNALVANNTFVNARGETSLGINNIELDGSASYTNSSFINNLIIQTTPGAILRVMGATNMSSFTVANNLYNVAPPSGWFNNEPGRVVGNPQLAAPNPPLPTAGNPVNLADYQLTYASPAFDQGQAHPTVADDFFGQTRTTTGLPDIGADELAYEGTIHIVQATTPVGAAQRFAYTAGFDPDGFDLGDGESYGPGLVAAGTHSVAAAPVEGWLTTAVCDDGSPAEAIVLSPGETVTCTFSSVRASQIVVVNGVTPVAGAPLFNFALTPGEAFQLGHGNRTFVAAAGVAHELTATAPEGWRRTAAACDNGDPVNAVVAEVGEIVTCTFAHEAMGRIVVTEQATPANTGQSFTFSAAYDNDGFALQHGQSDTSAYLPAGTYAVTAATPAGWLAAGATCDDGSAPAAVDLSPGETVICTFAHEQMGRVVVRKVTTPPNTGQLFSFSADYDPDGFTLADGQSNTSELLSPGDYTVSETVPPGWAQSSATCDDGSAPATIALNPGETVTCTFTNGRTASGPLATIYVTTPNAGTVRGLAYAPGDILAYDGRLDTWSLYFDASDVGITKPLSDFVLMSDGSLLLAISARVKLSPASGAQFWLEVQDVARFVPTSMGATTAGSFSLYFDGSDVALSTAGEKIDALARRADGALLISVTSEAAVKSGATTLKAADEDLMLFQPTSLGAATTGNWQLAFDGSTVAGLAVENVTSAWQDAAGMLYLTVTNNFTVGGVPGTSRTVLAITPARAVSVYWDAASGGLPGLVDGLHIVR